MTRAASGAAASAGAAAAAPQAVPPASGLPGPHLLLALAVVAVWGTNFVVIRVALDALPPLWLATLRFALAWFPAALLVPRPAVRWPALAGYGVLIGAGQFGLLFLALAGHLSPGLASLVVQVQVFFTIGLARVADGERVARLQWLALALAAAGIAVIAVRGDGDATPLGLLLVLGAAAAWAAGNQVSRRMGRVSMLGVMVWSSAFAVPVLAALAWWAEGPQRLLAGVAAAGPATWAAVVWQAVGNTLFGYAAWGWLLARHPAAAVAPMALGVPVFGIAASALLLGEALPAWKWAAAALVLVGLGLNLAWPRIDAALRRG